MKRKALYILALSIGILLNSISLTIHITESYGSTSPNVAFGRRVEYNEKESAPICASVGISAQTVNGWPFESYGGGSACDGLSFIYPLGITINILIPLLAALAIDKTFMKRRKI